MNLRPSGYEPDELPGCSTPRLIKQDRNYNKDFNFMSTISVKFSCDPAINSSCNRPWKRVAGVMNFKQEAGLYIDLWNRQACSLKLIHVRYTFRLDRTKTILSGEFHARSYDEYAPTDFFPHPACVGTSRRYGNCLDEITNEKKRRRGERRHHKVAVHARPTHLDRDVTRSE